MFFYWDVREDIKYYFAYFVRKGGTPALTDNFLAKKLKDLWGTKTPHFTDIPPKNCLLKGLKMVVFLPKNTFFFGRKKGYGFEGYPPKKLSSKGAKNGVFFCPNNTFFVGRKKGYGFGGYAPPPLKFAK